ncbi:hypothetical protein [Acinetobacter tjernbergiae]|uniref:Uncharacterized protein n=1 Tax=Acinetobacter tjernbergiae DSM 14971 = CIP 107465 TaxID=1120928 RepID=V2UWX0_9GAMM|nr:hypothetical protein [Acinetobacter tjernbergiae]ESK54502.1 hypothetical protein F990_02626 [Acinetobacter tjernbergiae DSM 14971 = CIP 107465]
MKAALIVIGVIFATFFLLNRCSKHDIEPTSSTQNTPIQQRQGALDQIVLLQPLKQHAVKEYESIQQTANSSIQSQEMVAAVSSTLWWKLREIVEKQADDEGQRLWANAYLQQLYDAKRKGNCFPISFPLYSKTSPDERRALLSQSTQQQTAAALTYILTHQGTRSIVERMQAPEAWSKIAEKLRQDYVADVDLLNAGETAKDKNKQCEVVARTFEYILSLPMEQQGPVIRWMLNNHITVGVF